MDDKYLNLKTFETYLETLNNIFDTKLSKNLHTHSSMETLLNNLENNIKNLQQTVDILKK